MLESIGHNLLTPTVTGQSTMQIHVSSPAAASPGQRLQVTDYDGLFQSVGTTPLGPGSLA